MHPCQCRFTHRWLFLVLLCISLPGTGADAPRLGDHPLVSHPWWVHEAGLSDRPGTLERLALADVVLLGEVHGNPDHHALQLEVLRGMVAAGRRPAVAFEIFDLGDQATIDRMSAREGTGADDLARAVDMASRGWDWSGYRPLVQFALDEGLPILAANLSREAAMDVARDGLTALAPEDPARLGLDRPMPDDLAKRLEERIVEAHCGHLPAARVEGMINAQKARDAYMADRLATTEGPVVLISGGSHTRLDYGVPWYLSRLAPDRQVISVRFTEVEADLGNAPEYLHDEGPVHHLLWFTRRISPEDPCEAFRRQLESMQNGT